MSEKEQTVSLDSSSSSTEDTQVDSPGRNIPTTNQGSTRASSEPVDSSQIPAGNFQLADSNQYSIGRRFSGTCSTRHPSQPSESSDDSDPICPLSDLNKSFEIRLDETEPTNKQAPKPRGSPQNSDSICILVDSNAASISRRLGGTTDASNTPPLDSSVGSLNSETRQILESCRGLLDGTPDSNTQLPNTRESSQNSDGWHLMDANRASIIRRIGRTGVPNVQPTESREDVQKPDETSQSIDSNRASIIRRLGISGSTVQPEQPRSCSPDSGTWHLMDSNTYSIERRRDWGLFMVKLFAMSVMEYIRQHFAQFYALWMVLMILYVFAVAIVIFNLILYFVYRPY